MAITKTTTQGFEPLRLTGEREQFWLPGNPGDTYTRGDLCVMNGASIAGEDGKAGCLEVATADQLNAVFRVVKTVTCAAASTSFPKPFSFDGSHDSSNTLVLVECISVAAGTPVSLVSFANEYDETVVSYATATRTLQMTTGMTADNYPNGALAYIYSGPAAGELNVVEDYDHTGGNVELEIITHRDWSGTPTTSSVLIILAGEAAANRGVSLMGRVALKDNNEVDVNDGANDGEMVVYAGWKEIQKYLHVGQLPVIPANAIYRSAY